MLTSRDMVLSWRTANKAKPQKMKRTKIFVMNLPPEVCFPQRIILPGMEEKIFSIPIWMEFRGVFQYPEKISAVFCIEWEKARENFAQMGKIDGISQLETETHSTFTFENGFTLTLATKPLLVLCKYSSCIPI